MHKETQVMAKNQQEGE